MYLKDHDNVGRAQSVTLPDLETLGFEWDAEGRPIEVTPPGQPRARGIVLGEPLYLVVGHRMSGVDETTYGCTLDP
ncbi:hypothetical protein ENSA7_60290 [Enhygromyxa salina]|uniref:Uncharacterized protein n=1 Tax=Enhygromyxa salina TaxID=215803 RepID=A0A2S9Y620_9BACT|nr:hypothetical protein ENSA7_60290 [Enhygromyxa salina]